MTRKDSPSNNFVEESISRIIKLYRESVKNVPILKYSWILMATVCILAIAGVFKLKNTDVISFAIGVIIISFLGFVFSYFMKTTDTFNRNSIRLLVICITVTCSIAILGFGCFIISGQPEFYKQWFPNQNHKTQPSKIDDTKEDSLVNPTHTTTEPAADTTTGHDAAKRKETRIDTIINITTPKGSQLAFDLIISNTSDHPADINKARLVNTFKVNKAGFDAFLTTERYDIWIDTIVPFRVDDDKTTGPLNLLVFENKDSLGYRGTGIFLSERSEKKSFYKIELEFPLFLQLKARSRNRIRLFFSGNRAKLKDIRKEGNATMASTMGEPQVVLNVQLRSTDGKLISYSIKNDQLLKAVLPSINN